MNWSNVALKGTIGFGTLGTVAILADPLDPFLGIWGLIVVVLVPFTILVFFRRDELPPHVVKIAHAVAVLWYTGMVAVSIGLMAARGFIPSDALMGAFMALGLTPCAVILRGMWRGEYDDK